MAYGVKLDNKGMPPIYQAMMDCGKDEGNRISLGFQDAFNWVEKLQDSNPANIWKMAEEYAELLKKYPKAKIYQTLHDVVTWEAEEAEKKIRPSEPSPESVYATFHQENLALWERAKKGELEAQLLLAHRYQEGKTIRQDHMSAYHWFARAAKNGGKEAATEGMSRSEPHLTDINRRAIDRYLKFDFFPIL